MYRLSEPTLRYLTVRYDKEEQLTGLTRMGDDDGRDDDRDDRRRGRRGDSFRGDRSRDMRSGGRAGTGAPAETAFVDDDDDDDDDELPNAMADSLGDEIEMAAASATSGILILLVVTKGIFTSPIILFVTQAKPPLGTMDAIVGTLASCHPIPVFMIVAPAFSISFARTTTSSQVLPPSTRSNIESRNIIISAGACRLDSPTVSRLLFHRAHPEKIRRA